MATAKQNAEFTNDIVVQYPLDAAIEWIKSNMEPGDVFTEDQLTDWANSAGYNPPE